MAEEGEHSSNSTCTFIETQQKHNEQQQNDYPLRLIISRMMFTYGDSDESLGICQEFVLDLLHGQLKMLINKAHNLSIERHSRSVGFPEFMFAFRRHPLLIRKLIAYMRLVDLMLMPSSLRSFDETQKPGSTEEEILPLVDTSSLGNQNVLDDPKLKNTSKVISAVRLIDVMGHLLADIDEHSLRAAKMERMRRMEARTRRMDAEDYERFAEARRTSFCSWTGRRTPIGAAKFLRWLHAPPMADGVVDALNFCATEIVAIVTESAAACREEENRRDAGTATNRTQTMRNLLPSNVTTSECLLRPLSIRHYEEAVRRNRGYAKRKDILFGYF